MLESHGTGVPRDQGLAGVASHVRSTVESTELRVVPAPVPTISYTMLGSSAARTVLNSAPGPSKSTEILDDPPKIPVLLR